MAAFLGTYGEVHYSDLKVGLDGDRAFATWTFSATKGSGELTTYRGVDIFEFEGDLIVLKDAYRKERSTPIG